MAEVAVEVLALQGFRPAGDPRDARISRLDVARDFSVRRPADWIVTAAPKKVRWCRNQGMYLGSDGCLEGLSARTGSTAFNLYDKAPVHAADEWTALHNLRFEVQYKASTGALKKAGLARLADLSTERVLALGERAWTRTGWGELMLGPTGLDVILGTEHDPETKAAMYGVYEAKRLGRTFGVRQKSPISQGLIKCGLFTHVHSPKIPPGVFHLDWLTGREFSPSEKERQIHMEAVRV
jgi:hypothetical protein